MEIRVYVNHDRREVLNEKDFSRLVNETAKEYANDDDRFSEWLDENFMSAELFNMTDKRRAEVRAEWEKVALDDVQSDMTCTYGGDWVEYEIEV